MDGQIGQNLAVNVDMGFFHPVDQAAVGYFIDPGGGVDTGNPEFPEIALPHAPVAESIFHGPFNGLGCGSQQAASCPEEALGHLQDLPSFLFGRNGSFYPRHYFVSCNGDVKESARISLFIIYKESAS
jgi:hypothetical protein